MTFKRAGGWVFAIVLLAAALATCLAWLTLRASRPLLKGELTLLGLSAPVDVPRDKLGVPTIVAANRLDASRALGFVHAQERFFQMDVLRRNAAGELAALFGAAALTRDRLHRLHRFRALAERVLLTLPTRDRAVIAAYAAGVNRGLQALGAAPFEYRVLRAKPEPWVDADTLLVLYSMFLNLNDSRGSRDREAAELRAALPAPVADWLTPLGSPADAALDGSIMPLNALPSADQFDLRTDANVSALALAPSATPEASIALGSNNFAIAGPLSAHLGAIIANDMHLGLNVPPLWFRARLRFSEAGHAVDATGVTLPGSPAIVAGSNGHVAWGFTNSYADVTDLVEITRDPQDATRYSRGALARGSIVSFIESIEVKGAKAQSMTVEWTEFGPLLPGAPGAALYAVRWSAHQPQAANFKLDQMVRARDVAGAFAICNSAGLPLQNLMVADRLGAIGWTLCGQIPARNPAISGAQPMPPEIAVQAIKGWLDAKRVPQVLNPSDGRLWTANARVLGGTQGTLLGDGGYAYGARAQQIRDRLRARKIFSEHDLYTLQLDDEARYLRPWQRLLAQTLSPRVVSAHPELRDFLTLTQVPRLHAERDSRAYTLLREFRTQVTRHTFQPYVGLVKRLSPRFTGSHWHYREALQWQLLEARPAHLLNPKFSDWDALLLVSVQDAHLALITRFGSLRAANWGQANLSAVRHPLSRSLPILAGLLDMPRIPLDGDDLMPRVQSPATGASERFVVSPGRESEGIFTLPGGQSGHPLSPYYRRGFRQWANGDSMPFLPMQTRYRLVLTP